MIYSLAGLRHDPVIGRNHQDHDIRRLRATGTHGGESRVARCIQKSDRAMVGLHLVGTDMLGNAAGLARRHPALADVIEQRGLAMVDVPHDGDHRRARGLLGLGRQIERCLDFGLEDILDLQHRGMPHFLDHQHRCVLVQNLIDRRHDPHLHERLDHLRGLDRHPLSQIGYRDRFRNTDVANHRRGWPFEPMTGLRHDRRFAGLELFLYPALAALTVKTQAFSQRFLALLLLAATILVQFLACPHGWRRHWRPRFLDHRFGGDFHHGNFGFRRRRGGFLESGPALFLQFANRLGLLRGDALHFLTANTLDLLGAPTLLFLLLQTPGFQFSLPLLLLLERLARLFDFLALITGLG